MANILCNKCRVAYRIQEAPVGAETFQCSDCPASFHTYDEGDVAVVGMSISQFDKLPHSAVRPVANDNEPDPDLSPNHPRSLGDSYGGPQFQWPFNTRFDDK